MGLAACYWDVENLHAYLASKLGGEDAVSVVADLMRRLRGDSQDSHDEQWLIQCAYADFDQVPDQLQSTLYLMGVEPIHVVGTMHKNAADMRLVTDVMETLYTRGAIRTFYVVSGDRDYIPVVNHPRKNGATVYVASFPAALSGDLRTVVGEAFLIDLTPYLPEVVPTKSDQQGAETPVAQRPSHAEDMQVAVDGMLVHHDRGHRVIWLTPFIREMGASLPHLSDWEVRQIVNELIDCGASQIQKQDGTSRFGDPIEFSVLAINWDNELVRQRTGARSPEGERAGNSPHG